MNPSEFHSAGGGGTPPPSPSKKPRRTAPSPPSPSKLTKESQNIKDLVQHYIPGKPLDDIPAGTVDVSPTAARRASIEKMTGMVTSGVEVGPFPGIITPPPTNLPLAAPQGFFPPMTEMAPFSTEFLSACRFLPVPTSPPPTVPARFIPPVTEMGPFSTELLSGSSSSLPSASDSVSSSAMVSSPPPQSPPASPTEEEQREWFKHFF
ncbi:hypothetical protein RIF29_11042 [Crotalaria pallida]|uniref:Uncharacterized protein n=1 Tax=Crotalaria pallida TaxID=3830 RepID=A0AAN9FWF0_CROPI